MFACNVFNPSRSLLYAAWVVLWTTSTYTIAQETIVQSTQHAVQATSIRYVSSSQVELFAGPGDDFYPTAILKSGQSIEVHQETPEGWLAITPPTGSFSWLPASQGLLLPGGRVVEVTEKSAVSWIGTTLGTAKQYRWQVKLERGQQLAVIGEQTIHDPTSGSKALWYKITPPAGEYRWIQAKATTQQLPPSNTPALATNTPANSEAQEPTLAIDGSDQQVVPASSVEPTQASNKKPARTAARPGKPHQHVDPWADWHALEFKNGAFSFPGMARMLGIPPAQPTNPRATEDPFDLTASYARGQPNKANLPPSTSDSRETIDGENHEPATSTMAVRQSRGWRDPRQLRQERTRGVLGDNEPNDSALVSNESDDADADVMDASFEDHAEVGTSVVTAGAIEARDNDGRLNSVNRHAKQTNGNQRTDQAWYGIEQAPASEIARTMNHANTAPLASLEEIQLELSTMVAGPEQTWNLAPLAERARYFIEHGKDSLQRGQARLLLERIESFAQVAHQSASPPSSPPNASIMRSIPTTTAAATSGSVPATPASWIAPGLSSPKAASDLSSGPKFDATGWLVPVHSSGRDMPTHALTNDTGRIIVYVTPAPGVNLTRFESQAIGVYGLRGYLPQLKTNHIQIQRVVRLQ